MFLVNSCLGSFAAAPSHCLRDKPCGFSRRAGKRSKFVLRAALFPFGLQARSANRVSFLSQCSRYVQIIQNA